MSQGRSSFCGVDLIACPSGALYLPAYSTLAVADLHLEKGSAWAGRGRLLPPYDSRATLAALAAAVERFSPGRVVCLGDSFDDRAGTSRLGAESAGVLRQLMSGRDWIWIAGNHDPAPPGLGGRHVSEFALGPFLFRHAARTGSPAGEVSGHFHPKATVAAAGSRFTGRCFVGDGRRLILPAFGAYTGGLDVFHPALSALLAPDFFVHLIGRSRVHAFPADRLVGRAGAGAAARPAVSGRR